MNNRMSKNLLVAEEGKDIRKVVMAVGKYKSRETENFLGKMN